MALKLIEEGGVLSQDQFNEESAKQAELFNILENRELYQKNETWPLKGHNNTKEFRRVANGRKRIATIFNHHDTENIIEGDSNLLQYATNYYEDLFGPAPRYNFPNDHNLWSGSKNWLK